MDQEEKCTTMKVIWKDLSTIPDEALSPAVIIREMPTGTQNSEYESNVQTITTLHQIKFMLH